jgi:dGTP triphosphohydrolase
VADTIASMTDDQALRMHQRLTGQSLGPPLNPILM